MKKILLLSCTLMQLFFAQAQTLVAYYPFCGNANDANGNTHNGTNTGIVTPVTDRFSNAKSENDFFYDDIIDEVKICDTTLMVSKVLAEINAVSAIANIGNYRSAKSGKWRDASTWEVFNGTSFVAASVAPSNSDGNITIRSGHTVTVTDMVSTDQTIVAFGGTIIQSADLGIANGNGEDLTINGSWIWKSGSLLGPVAANPSATILVSSGGIFNLFTSGLKKFRSAPTITNNGSMNWQDGDLEFEGVFNPSLINNGLFTISGNNTSSANAQSLIITNNGTITKTSSGTTNMSGILLLSNAGSLNCTAGNFLFGQEDIIGTFTNTGNIVLSNGASFTVATVYNHNMGAVISGTGNFTNHGTVNFNINQNFPSSIVFTNTEIIAGSGDLVINNPFTIEGIITGGGLLNIKEAAIWEAANIARNFIVDAGRTLTLANGGVKRLNNGASLTNNGSIDWQNGNIDISGLVNSTLVNNGLFTISGNLSIGSTSNIALQITNNGSIIKTSTGTTILESISVLLNAGTFTCNGNIIFGKPLLTSTFTNLGTGIVHLINSNFTNVSNATFNNNEGGILKGSGVYSFPSFFNSNGIIAPGSSPGILTIAGQEPLSANSTLQIEMLNGSGAGTGHDQLVRGASVTLAGTLTVTETGTVPPGTYTILNLTSGAISGSFASVNLPGCYTLLVNASNVQVVKGTPPATPSISAGGVTTFCAGGSVTLTSSAATTYLWSNGATTQSINVNTSGIFTVIITNENGCSSAASLGTTVTVNPLPLTPTITASGVTAFCQGDSVTLTSSSQFQNFWSNGATTRSITVKESGSFTVIKINLNGCSSAASAATSVVVTAPVGIITSINGKRDNLCGGVNNIKYSIDAVANATDYLWTVPSTCTLISGQGTPEIRVDFPANYTTGFVTVIASNSCGSTLIDSLKAIAKPGISSKIHGPKKVSSNQTGIIFSINNTEGLNYTWVVPAGAIITAGQGNSSITVTWGTQSGDVTVVATNSCGVSGIKAHGVRIQNSGPTSISKEKLDLSTEKAKLFVYPNPAQHEFVINLQTQTGKSGKAAINIYNLNGKAVYTSSAFLKAGKLSEKIVLPVGFANGEYVVKLLVDGGSYTAKLIIVR